jgi:hypothetical protein
MLLPLLLLLLLLLLPLLLLPLPPQIPMFRSGNDFTYIHNLTRGKHVYKFIVDDEWRFAPDQVCALLLHAELSY